MEDLGPKRIPSDGHVQRCLEQRPDLVRGIDVWFELRDAGWRQPATRNVGAWILACEIVAELPDEGKPLLARSRVQSLA